MTENETGTVYAMCPNCAHVEPRPAHARQDWQACENCRQGTPALFTDPVAAEEASEDVLRARREEDGPTDDEIYNRPGMEGGISYPIDADARSEHDDTL